MGMRLQFSTSILGIGNCPSGYLWPEATADLYLSVSRSVMNRMWNPRLYALLACVGVLARASYHGALKNLNGGNGRLGCSHHVLDSIDRHSLDWRIVTGTRSKEAVPQQKLVKRGN